MVFLVFVARAAVAAELSAYERVVAKGEIVCGIIPWAPYKTLDPTTGEWGGFAIDLYRKAFATLDIKIVYKEVLLGSQVQDLNSGRVDAICDDGPWTLSSGKFVEYSDPFYAILVYPYVRSAENTIKTRQDLNSENVTFTGIDGDLSSDLVARLFPKATLLTMPANTDVSQLFLNVRTKKADVTISDPVSLSAFEKTNPNQLKPLFNTAPLGVYKTAVSVKKGDFKLLTLVNQAVDNALNFGIVDEVLDTVDPKRISFGRVQPKFKY